MLSVSVSWVYFLVLSISVSWVYYLVLSISVSRVSCVQYGLILNISSGWIGALGVHGGRMEKEKERGISGGEMRGGGMA